MMLNIAQIKNLPTLNANDLNTIIKLKKMRKIV